MNKQSTYLYDFLNGFSNNNIKWVDAKWAKSEDLKIKPAPRQNVYNYEYEKDKKAWIKQSTKDLRKWSFTRLDEI